MSSMNTDAPMIAGLRPCSENLREQAGQIPSDSDVSNAGIIYNEEGVFYSPLGVAVRAESSFNDVTVPYNIQHGFLEIQERNDVQDARIDDLQSQVDYLRSQLHALQWAINGSRPFV